MIFDRAALEALRASLQTGQHRLVQHDSAGLRELLLMSVAILCGAIGVALASGGYHGGFHALQSAAHALLPDTAWAWVTRFGDARILFLVSLLFMRRRPEVFWALIVAAVIGTLYSRGLKLYFDELRPPALVPPSDLTVIGPRLTRHSFPSGHTMTIFLYVGVLFAFANTWWQRALLLLAATLVGISRVALGVHWPQDVLAGAFSGLMFAAFGVWLATRWRAGLRLGVHLGLLSLPLLSMVLLYTGDDGNPSTPTLVCFAVALGLVKLISDYGGLVHIGRTAGAGDARDRAG